MYLCSGNNVGALPLSPFLYNLCVVKLYVSTTTNLLAGYFNSSAIYPHGPSLLLPLVQQQIAQSVPHSVKEVNEKLYLTTFSIQINFTWVRWLLSYDVCKVWYIIFLPMGVIWWGRWLTYHDFAHPDSNMGVPTWAHLGPTGPRWAPCWPHEPCYLGSYDSRKSRQMWLRVNRTGGCRLMASLIRCVSPNRFEICQKGCHIDIHT